MVTMVLSLAPGAPQGFEPCYLSLPPGELARRAELAVAALADCTVCPRDCHVDRLADQTQACHTGRLARVGSWFHHRGEEDCLRGWQGSGTIFFSFCNLRCVFCQNWDVSQAGHGDEVSPEQLAAIMLELQEGGCHNINFVTPEHVVPQVLEAVTVAVEQGLRLPLVYNTSAYDSLHSLQLMDGVVDIYMPDFKLWESNTSKRYLKAADYPDVARAALHEMHRQVGPLQIGADGLARRGVLVRHLVMPGALAETRLIMRFLARELSTDTYVNVMAQYHPEHHAQRYEELNRRITPAEFLEARQMAREEGIQRLDERAPPQRPGHFLDV